MIKSQKSWEVPNPPITYFCFISIQELDKEKDNWGCSSEVECLPSMCKAPGSIPSTVRKFNQTIKKKKDKDANMVKNL
jgi:hypothetical protein